MAFFKKLFGKKEEEIPQQDPMINLFQEDFIDAMYRYVGSYESDVKLNFKDELGEPLPYAFVFSDTFETWKGIESVWDKRGVIFKQLDQILGEHLSLEQMVNRFVIDRYAEHALNIAEKNATEEDLNSSSYWAAVASAQLILYRYADAEESANKALSLNSNNRQAETTLADIYHLTQRHDKAHEIYAKLLKNSSLDRSKEISLLDIVGFRTQVIYSPIYAVNMLHGIEGATEDTWNWIATEFYHSPHFRAQHAYFLLNQGEHLKGMAKLVSLSQEMPWYKEGVMNARSVIAQMGIEEMMAEEVKRLDEIIQNNSWQ